MKKVTEKKSEENLIFGFEEGEFHLSADEQTKEKQQFMALTQLNIYEEPVNPSESNQISELIRQQLFGVTFSAGLRCQKNWREVACIAADDLAESLSRCNLDDVIDDLHNLIFAKSDETKKVNIVGI